MRPLLALFILINGCASAESEPSAATSPPGETLLFRGPSRSAKGALDVYQCEVDTRQGTSEVIRLVPDTRTYSIAPNTIQEGGRTLEFKISRSPVTGQPLPFHNTEVSIWESHGKRPLWAHSFLGWYDDFFVSSLAFARGKVSFKLHFAIGE